MNKIQKPNAIESRLARAETLGEFKAIRDQAEALRVYARSIKGKLKEQNWAAKIKILAEHGAGKILKTVPKVQGNRNGQKGLLSTLERSGICLGTAHKWQAISEIPTSRIEELEASKTEAGEELTSRELFDMARRSRAEARRPPPITEPGEWPQGKFRTIVIDPPWPIEKIILNRRPVEKEEMDYPTMSLKDIAALPIKSLADDGGCHVFMWVTHRFLPAGLQLFEAWGVRYECVITWNKPTAQPLWWRFLTEHCLFGKIGSLALVKKGCAVSFAAPQQRHSHKPEQFFNLVRTVSPEPRITLFDYARAGFVRWGITH